MTRGDYIPFDIFRMIIVRLISPSVESLNDWTECISVLAVSRLWRMVGEPMLYSIVISIDAFSNMFLTIHSNTSLVVSNGFENYVRAAVIHISPSMTQEEAMAAFFWYMPNNLTTSLNRPSIMYRFWRMIGTPTFVLGGACIEPLMLSMPNLRYLFVESRFMNEPWKKYTSMFLHYSVALQASVRNDISSYNGFDKFDFIESFNHESIPALNAQTAMTRMVLALSSHEQTPASRSRRRIVPSNDHVQFYAEYIKRLRILDLPQSALSLDTSIDALRDRNPCMTEEYYMRSPWYIIRYRSYLYVPNIWFENFRGVTRYDLYAFNRNENNRELQIATSMPPEVSETLQSPDNSSDYVSSGSESDDN